MTQMFAYYQFDFDSKNLNKFWGVNAIWFSLLFK